jgi:hypothetical protein
VTGRHDDDRGTITAFVAVVGLALVMVAGMAYDGGQVIAAQATARSDAAKAARAGAQEIDIAHLRATGEAILDPARAEAAALGYLEQASTPGTVTVDGASLTVTVSITQPMRILPIPDRTVVVTETATAVDEPIP